MHAMSSSRPPSYAPVPHSYIPNPQLRANINVDEEVKLAGSPEEFHYWDGIAEVYSIIKTLDGLERVWMKDAVTDAEYTELCTKLLSQYKFILNDDVIVKGFENHEWMRGFQDLETFTREWDMNVPRAIERIRVGLPATVEQPTHNPAQNNGGGGSGASGGLILAATENLITFLDALKLNMLSKDALHPLLSEVIQSVNKVTDRDFENRGKIIQWLITLNQMRATQELSEDQARELHFDIEQAYHGFKATLT